MQLRLSASPVAKVARNVTYTPGRDFRLSYAIELNPGDYPLGTTLVSALLVAESSFGLAPLVTKAITGVLSANGQITDTGADGQGALYFALAPGETTAFAQAPVAFEVIVVDSLGRQATLDIGSLVPTESTVGRPVDHVTVAPKVFSLTDPNTVALTVTVYDADNNILTGRVVNWTSSNPATATIDPTTGVVTGIGAGDVLFTVTVEGESDSSTGTFTSNVTTVTVLPSPADVAQGATAQLTATPRDAGGVIVPNQTLVWASSDPTKATVDQAGVVTGVAMGAVTITATIANTAIVGNTTLTVTQALDGSLADLLHQISVAETTNPDGLMPATSLRFAWEFDNAANLTLSGGNLVSAADARGGGFGTALASVGGSNPAYNAGTKSVTLNGADNFLQTVAHADLDLSITPRDHWMAAIVEIPSLGFAPIAISDDAHSRMFVVNASRSSDGGAFWSQSGSFAGPESNVPAGAGKPALVMAQYCHVTVGDPHGEGIPIDTAYNRFSALRVWGELPHYSWNKGPIASGNNRIIVGGLFGAVPMTLKALYYGWGAPPKNVWQALERRAQLGFGIAARPRPTAEALGVVSGMGDSNMEGAGTTNPATKNWMAVMTPSVPAGYGIRNCGVNGQTLATGRFIFIKCIEPALDATLLGKVFNAPQYGTNDLLHITPNLTSNLQDVARRGVAGGALNVIPTVIKIGGGFLDATQQALLLSHNTVIRGLPALVPSQAAAVFDAWATCDPTGADGNGDNVHLGDSGESKFATGLLAALTAAGMV